MKHRPSHGLILSLALLGIVVGCSSDERLGLPKIEQVDLEGIDAGVTEVQRKQEIQGTFNPAALRYFDNKGWQDRTAKASEETAKNTKRLVQVTLDNKLAFV